MPPTHRHRSARRLLPAALALLALGAGALVVKAERAAPSPAALAQRSPMTPVLSARRAPAVIAAPVADNRLNAELQQLLAGSPGSACLDVAVEGRHVFAAGTADPFTPASLQKLVTGAAAVSILGPDTRLTTRVKAAAAPEGGVVLGDLYLVGGGDPLLMTEEFAAHLKHPPAERTSAAALADAIAATGLKEVRGRLLGDDSRYDAERYPPSWPERFATEGESGPISALALDRGFDQFPPTPEQRTPKEHAAPDPPAHAATVLTQLLAARGVTIAGGAGSGVAPAGAVEIADLPSAPVQGMVAEMVRESDNLAAELLTKEVGVVTGGGGTTAAGTAAIRAELGRLGLPVDGTAQIDGSGLSEDDRETCALVSAVLVRDGPTGPISTNLPVAGQTGTLEKRFVGSAVVGRLRAKTGTLNQVTALAGVLPTARGVTVTFSYVLNLAKPARVTDDDLSIQDRLVAVLDTYPAGPDLAALGPLP
ncbi:MAG: D-alanyl-D-alanine carboxypeptidase/D-alanyl-D-alanine-endopeptidase [Acidimicrobiales bacterium]